MNTQEISKRSVLIVLFALHSGCGAEVANSNAYRGDAGAIRVQGAQAIQAASVAFIEAELTWKKAQLEWVKELLRHRDSEGRLKKGPYTSSRYTAAEVERDLPIIQRQIESLEQSLEHCRRTDVEGRELPRICSFESIALEEKPDFYLSGLLFEFDDLARKRSDELTKQGKAELDPQDLRTVAGLRRRELEIVRFQYETPIESARRIAK